MEDCNFGCSFTLYSVCFFFSLFPGLIQLNSHRWRLNDTYDDLSSQKPVACLSQRKQDAHQPFHCHEHMTEIYNSSRQFGVAAGGLLISVEVEDVILTHRIANKGEKMPSGLSHKRCWCGKQCIRSKHLLKKKNALFLGKVVKLFSCRDHTWPPYIQFLKFTLWLSLHSFWQGPDVLSLK